MRYWAAVLLAALPWLNPVTYGPTGPAVPWLVGIGCALALWMLARLRISSAAWRLLGLAAILVLWAWTVHPGTGPRGAVPGRRVGPDRRGGWAGLRRGGERGLATGFAGCSLPQCRDRPLPVLRCCRRAGALGQRAPSRRGLRQPAPTEPVRHAVLARRGGASVGRIGGSHGLWRSCWRSLLAAGSAASGSRTALLQGLVLAGLSAAVAGWRTASCVSFSAPSRRCVFRGRRCCCHGCSTWRPASCRRARSGAASAAARPAAAASCCGPTCCT